jgi:pyridoxamine 5'-phosphate oxidase
MGKILTLDDFYHFFVDQLNTAVKNRKAPLHLLTLGTTSPDGPDLRTMVLRDFDQTSRSLFFHTDYRSEKIAQIQTNPTITIHGFDPNLRLQIQLYGVGKIHRQNPLARERWEKSQAMSRVCYTVPQAPQSEINTPEEGYSSLITTHATLDNTESGYTNFSVLECQFDRVVCYSLSAQGHIRAEFKYTSSEDVSKTWLSP